MLRSCLRHPNRALPPAILPMQVIAHNGPNWLRDSLSVCAQIVAIPVRSTILLYNSDAGFLSELRATGTSAPITSISFCHSPVLTSLLAVATVDGHVRIFDTQQKRVFRVINDGRNHKSKCFAVRFIPNAPHRLLLVAEKLSVYEFTLSVKRILSTPLPFTHVHLVETIPNLSKYVLLAGKNHPNLYSLQICNIYNSADTKRIVEGFPVQDLTILYRPDHSIPYIMAVVSSDLPYPKLFTSPDGISWHPFSQITTTIPAQVQLHERSRKQKATSRSAHLRKAACWIASNILLVTDVRGAIIAWQLDHNQLQLRFLARRRFAHMRQIFSLQPLSDHDFLSTSMDRTLARWRLADIIHPSIALQWRTLRANGPVSHIAIAPMQSTHQGRYIAFTSSSGSVACVQWLPSENTFSLLAEASPLGQVLGKRKQSAISYIVSTHEIAQKHQTVASNPTQPLFVFGLPNGRQGAFSIVDGDVKIDYIEKQHKQFTTLFHEQAIKMQTDQNSTVSLPSQKNQATVKQLSPSSEFKPDFLNSHRIVPLRSKSAQCREETEKPEFFIATDQGDLKFACRCKEIITVLPSIPLSSIRYIQYDSYSSLMAISYSNGSLAILKIFRSPPSLKNATACHTEQSLSIEERCRRETSGAIYLIQWSEPEGTEAHQSFVPRHLLTASVNGEIFVWHCDSKGILTLRAQMREHHGLITGAVWHGSKYALTAGEDGTLRRWEIERLPRHQNKSQ